MRLNHDRFILAVVIPAVILGASPRLLAQTSKTSLVLKKSVNVYLNSSGEEIDSPVLSADGKLYAFVGQKSNIRFVQIGESRTGKRGRRFRLGNVFGDCSVVIGPKNESIAVLTNEKVQILSLGDGKQKSIFPNPDASDGTICFSKDGRQVAFRGANNNICVMALETGKIRRLAGLRASAQVIAFSDNNEYIAAGVEIPTPIGNDSLGEVRIWNLKSGQGKTLPQQKLFVHHLTFSPDSSTLAVAAGTVELWDIKTWTKKKVFEEISDASCVAFSPNGSTLVIGSGLWTNVLSIHNLKSGQVMNSSSAHKNVIQSLAYSPDGKEVVSADANYEVKTWAIP